jgi:hypothetical protein
MAFSTLPLSNEKLTAAKLQALITELRPRSVRKASDGTAFPSTTALANDEDLLLSATGGVTYDFESAVWYVAGTTADLKLAWTFPTGTLEYLALGYSTTSTTPDEVLSQAEVSDSPHSFGGQGIGAPRYVWFRGRYACTTDGTLRLRRAQNTSTAENTKILAGSWLRLQQAV